MQSGRNPSDTGSESFDWKSIEETEIRHKYRLNIIAIENGDETDIEVMPDYRLRHGDIIVVIGKVDNIDVFVNEI